MSQQSYAGDVPDIFKIADQTLKVAERGKESPKRKPRIKPMPTISNSSSIKGPIHVTQDFCDSWEQEKEVKEKVTKREYERKIMGYLAKKLHLQSKLVNLDIKKRNDSRKIAAINAQLLEIERKLTKLQEESGIDIKHLERGSKIARFINAFKKKARKIWRKIKKFWKKLWRPDRYRCKCSEYVDGTYEGETCPRCRTRIECVHDEDSPRGIIIGVLSVVASSLITLFLHKVSKA